MKNPNNGKRKKRKNRDNEPKRMIRFHINESAAVAFDLVVVEFFIGSNLLLLLVGGVVVIVIVVGWNEMLKKNRPKFVVQRNSGIH